MNNVVFHLHMPCRGKVCPACCSTSCQPAAGVYVTHVRCSAAHVCLTCSLPSWENSESRVLKLFPWTTYQSRIALKAVSLHSVEVGGEFWKSTVGRRVVPCGWSTMTHFQHAAQWMIANMNMNHQKAHTTHCSLWVTRVHTVHPSCQAPACCHHFLFLHAILITSVPGHYSPQCQVIIAPLLTPSCRHKQ